MIVGISSIILKLSNTIFKETRKVEVERNRERK